MVTKIIIENKKGKAGAELALPFCFFLKHLIINFLKTE